MRVATWNVNSIRARLEQVLDWAGRASPDVLCLQETKVTDDLFPSAPLAEAGFAHQVVHGQKTYNGVAILSRRPVHDAVEGFTRGGADDQARLVRATVGGVRIWCAYAPMGTAPGTAKFAYKLEWFERLLFELRGEGGANHEILLCGDLNVAPGDADVWDPFACEGRVLFTAPERAALGKLLDWGLADAYRELQPHGGDFTWWDYRGGAFWKNQGFRLDHVLVSPPLLERCTAVRVHRETRKWDRPSDHVPVVLDLEG